MFGIGMPELVVIMVVALIVLGPKRLPEAARGLGRALGELRRATSGITEELNNAQVMMDEEAHSIERATRTPHKPPTPSASTPPAEEPTEKKEEVGGDR